MQITLDIIEPLAGLGRETWITVLILAVVISPYIYRWRLKVRRILRQIGLVAVGIAIGMWI